MNTPPVLPVAIDPCERCGKPRRLMQLTSSAAILVCPACLEAWIARNTTADVRHSSPERVPDTRPGAASASRK
jgi:predicted RNA-binding Zn-ribbon protein involved in translation (DUF1610 family)